MNFQHATIWLNRGRARVLQFEDQQFPVRCFKNEIELRSTGKGSDSAAAFLDKLCLVVDAVPQVLVTGTPEAIAEFERHVASRKPRLARRIVGVQCVAKPTNARLSALTRWHFTKANDLASTAG